MPGQQGSESEMKMGSTRRRSVLMDSSLKNFQKMMDSAEDSMAEEIEKLPLNMRE